MKEENILNEGLEKASEKKDNMSRISCFAFGNPMGCPPCLANLNLPVLLAYYRMTASFMEPSKKVQEFSY